MANSTATIAGEGPEMPYEPYVVVTDWIVGGIPVYRIREVRTGTYVEFEGR
jgi:hypothetical protein